MNSKFKIKALLVLFVFVRSVSSARVKRNEPRMDMYDLSPGKRTFLMGKMLLVPALAALGMKFLALLPIFLAKIALLGIMNFVSTNANLILTTFFNLKSFFNTKNPWWKTEEEYSFLKPTGFEFSSTQHPFVNYDFLLNRRSIKPEKGTKIIKFVDGQNHFATSGNSFTSVYPYARKLIYEGKNLPSAGSNNDEFRRKNVNPGSYQCYWTDSSGDHNKLIRKQFDTDFYNNNQYLVRNGNSDKESSTNVQLVVLDSLTSDDCE